jgi:asparagine synthase (glutamine-hydrolysing)
MTIPAGLATVPSWFVVLPDRPEAATVTAALRCRARRVVCHPSGRPWLLGHWADGDATVAQAGSTKIAVIGQHAFGPDRLAGFAADVRTLADVDRLSKSLVGSAHVIVSMDGLVRVQGTITSLRRVFHVDLDACAVAADRADVLAELAGSSLDEARLAIHLLEPFALYPITGEPVWRGVTALRTDHYLVLDRDGRQHSMHWWTPPEPTMPMAEGALALRDALGTAVDARVRGLELVSSDLGGVDSTSVCCLAARGAAPVVAYTLADRDPLGDDVAWARRTVAEVANIEHHVVPADQVPLVYHGIREPDDALDEPCVATVDRDRWLVIARAAADRGSRIHLSGFGGDEIAGGAPAHLHGMLRCTPRTALRHLRGFAALYRWPYRQALRQLLDHKPYHAWLSGVADDLLAPSWSQTAPNLGWGVPTRLPSWTTSDAVDAVRKLIRAAAPTVQPLAPGHGQHQELEAMRAVTRVIRQLGQMAERIGIPLASPYYDDRVLEAGLAVRPQERITPWRYKPLLVEAMSDIVPQASLTRVTKADSSHDVTAGLREHRADLLAMFEDSELGRLGIVDAAALREVCAGPLPPELPYCALYQTVACEAWLQSLHKLAASTPS